MRSSEEKKSGPSQSFVTGIIALVFLILGYQTALFVHQAAVMKIAANRDEPDTVFIYAPVSDRVHADVLPPQPKVHEEPSVVRKESAHTPLAQTVRQNLPRKNTESFRFDPNTVSVEDLCRLGFTPKQAKSIDNYRLKGGRFNRRSDFAKSFVVSDSVYRRLEPYIDIPLLDLNLADSAAFDALPGIGGWFAAKMVEHRTALGGYSCKEQLMDIYRFDREKFDALSDLVTVSSEYVTPYPLWSHSADSLRMHPYIKNWETASAIVIFRESTPADQWSIENLASAGILSDDQAAKLKVCALK